MILGSAICFGSYGVWSRYISHDFGVFFQGWVRSVLILVVLGPIYFFQKNHLPLFRKEAAWLWVTMLFSVFTVAPLYFAYVHMAIGTATLIFYSVFLITSYLIGWLFLKESITPVKLVSLGLALLGLIITFRISIQLFSTTALLLAALNGIASGGEASTSKKSTHIFSTVQVTFYCWLAIFVTHLPLSIFFGEKQIALAFSFEWLAMLGYAGAGLVGFWLLIEGFKRVDASIGGLIGLLEIIFSIIFGILLFKDHLTWTIVLGGVLIILAAMLPDLTSLLQGKHD